MRIDDASPSPAAAANQGVRLAGGDLVGLTVDGARLASPGLLAGEIRANGVSTRAVVTALAWHLGSVPHMKAAEAGYDQTAAREPSTSSMGARPPELPPTYLPHLERSARLAAEGFPKRS